MLDELIASFVPIPAGRFCMGSDQGRENEQPIHAQTIALPFTLCRHTVTQSVWRAVMDDEPWRRDDGALRNNVEAGDDYPATYITYNDAVRCIERLNDLDTNAYYRLPNETEWEYAARANTTTAFSFGDVDAALSKFGWYQRNTQQAGLTCAQPVGRKLPNPWGLHDMHGNIWEWVSDTYYGSHAALPNQRSVEKVLRGGGWDYPSDGSRSAFRESLLPSRTNHAIGFRLVRIPLSAEFSTPADLSNVSVPCREIDGARSGRIPSPMTVPVRETAQFRQIQSALLSGFNFSTLTSMLRGEMGVRLEDITIAQSFTEVVLAVVSWAENTDQLEKLIGAAYRANPTNRQIAAMYADLG